MSDHKNQPPAPESPGERFTHQLGIAMRQLLDWGRSIGVNVDGIRVIASSQDNEGAGITATHSHGAGNYHAQIGAVEEWLKAKRSYEHGYNHAEGERDFWDHNPPTQQDPPPPPFQGPPFHDPTDEADWWKQDADE